MRRRCAKCRRIRALCTLYMARLEFLDDRTNRRKLTYFRIILLFAGDVWAKSRTQTRTHTPATCCSHYFTFNFIEMDLCAAITRNELEQIVRFHVCEALRNRIDDTRTRAVCLRARTNIESVLISSALYSRSARSGCGPSPRGLCDANAEDECETELTANTETEKANKRRCGSSSPSLFSISRIKRIRSQFYFIKVLSTILSICPICPQLDRPLCV